MSRSLIAKFDTRREAEMTVERLVQQFGIERTDVFVSSEGDRNTAGVEQAGSDTQGGDPSPADRNDTELTGRVTVSGDIQDESLATEIRSTFVEFDADEISEG